MNSDPAESSKPSATSKVARKRPERLKREKLFEVLVPVLGVLVGTIVGFVGAWQTTAAQLHHDSQVQHQTQAAAACAEVGRAMQAQVSQLNGAWLDLRIPVDRQQQSDDLTAVITAADKTADAVPGLYLIASSAVIQDISKFEDDANQAESEIVDGITKPLPVGPVPSSIDLPPSIAAAHQDVSRMLEDCRQDLLS